MGEDELKDVSTPDEKGEAAKTASTDEGGAISEDSRRKDEPESFQKLYQESDASREMRMKLAEERKAMPRVEGFREGKPSKRDRREIGRLRGRL